MERLTRSSAAKSTPLQGAPLKRVPKKMALGLEQPKVAVAAGGLELALKPEVFAGTVVPAVPLPRQVKLSGPFVLGILTVFSYSGRFSVHWPAWYQAFGVHPPGCQGPTA